MGDNPICHRSHLPLLKELGFEAQAKNFAYGQALEFPRITFRPWQVTGREWASRREEALIADEMRLGKTVTALSTWDPSRGPLFVAAPLATRAVWLDWIGRLYPGVRVRTLQGVDYDRDAFAGVDVVFCHYNILPAWQTAGGRYYGLAIFDEIHELSKGRSLRTQAGMLIRQRAERVIGLTGTPLWNEPAGLYHVLSTLSPGAWGTWTDFAKRYASGVPGPHGLVVGAPSNVDEFQWRMTEVMLRRTWADVRADLPPTEREVRIIRLTEEQRRRVDFRAEEFRTSDATNTIATLSRLRRALAEAKVELAADEALNVLCRGEPVVVWAWHKGPFETLRNLFAFRGFQPIVVTGDVGQDERDRRLEEWRASKHRPLLATLAVGQVGIDLSHARTCIFCELDWTPAILGQAEMRTFSPVRPMRAVYIATDHDVEAGIVDILRRKLSAADLMQVPAAEGAIKDILSRLGDAGGRPDLERLKRTIVGSGQVGNEGRRGMWAPMCEAVATLKIEYDTGDQKVVPLKRPVTGRYEGR